MAGQDDLFWPSLYGRLAPTRYRSAGSVDLEEEALDAAEAAGSFGLNNFFTDFDTLKAHVERELAELLNTSCLEAALVGAQTRGGVVDTLAREDYPFEHHPLVRESIVNYGAPAFVGRNIHALSTKVIEDRLRRAIAAFEPRIRAATMRVNVTSAKGDKAASDRPLEFTVEGEILGVDQTMRIVINTLWDPDKMRSQIEGVEIEY